MSGCRPSAAEIKRQEVTLLSFESCRSLSITLVSIVGPGHTIYQEGKTNTNHEIKTTGGKRNDDDGDDGDDADDNGDGDDDDDDGGDDDDADDDDDDDDDDDGDEDDETAVSSGQCRSSSVMPMQQN